MKFTSVEKGCIPPCNVAPNSLMGVPRVQTNPSRWHGDGWQGFVEELKSKGVVVREEEVGALHICYRRRWTRLWTSSRCGSSLFFGGCLQGLDSCPDPSGSLLSQGAGAFIGGEAIAFGGLLLDMTSMNRVLEVDRENMTVRTEAGIFWHQLAEVLRRDGLDYLSAPLNMTSTVGGPWRRRDRYQLSAPGLQRRPGIGPQGCDPHRGDSGMLRVREQ